MQWAARHAVAASDQPAYPTAPTAAPPSPLPPPLAAQLEPKDLSEQLKRTGAAIPGSVFLGALSAAPAAVEAITHLSAFRGFAGTSVLIMVGVATDTARRIRAEQAMSKYLDRATEEYKL